MDLSVIVPIFNEEENIRPLVEGIGAVLAPSSYDYEILLVDDGSHDNSFTLLKEMASRDRRVKVIRLRRNFGQTAAMAAGFNAAMGSIVIPMDGDLQNDPTDIGRLMEKVGEPAGSGPGGGE